ncbi:contractile injection system tape measure protein [Methylobacter sp. BBA5.1]|uniref:contractile injection system tape measure protein n=1 Tax=Methylobacter sp. BBA5.1 TaxID=1495064 RepID=UPI00056D5279|nr:contractile injection system tape measure protein [Methylobacter sp. BBA5.1]
MTHTIRRHHLHIRVNGTEADGLALHNRLPDWCRNRLFPAIESALDRCVPATEHWSLERLEIDVGEIALDRLEQDLPGLVGRALEKSLRTLQPPAGHEAAAAGGITQKPSPQRIEEAWVYFLTTGTLPWGLRLPAGENLERALLRIWQENPSSRHSGAVLAALASAGARQRLVRQFSEAFLAILLKRLAPDLETIMANIMRQLNPVELAPETIKPFARQLWEAAFALMTSSGPYTETRIIRAAWRQLPVTAIQRHYLATLLERSWPGVIGEPENQPPDQRFPASENTINGNARNPDGRVSEDARPDQHPEAAEGIYIENAGLVLLHPFLPRFFQALGIASENDVILQPERALCLLHFLATGQRIAPEHELVLPKILCNIPLTAPAGADMDLTDPETEEAAALLEAVIGHWDVLKNTGIDGLRGTFLLRAGKITRRDDGDWRLQVESKAFDILMDQLPWGISMIKLPWMPRMLWVEWRY